MRASILFLIAAMFVCGCHTVRFESDPPGASVYVDGVYWGTTPFSHVWVFGQKASRFTAGMVLPGYEWGDCKLIPKSMYDDPNSTLMACAPDGGKIFVDGVYVGDAPINYPLFFPRVIKGVWSKNVLAGSKYKPQADQPATQPVAQASGKIVVKKKYAVIVGVSEYKFRGKWNLSNLRYADADAVKLAEYLRSDTGGRFDEVILLTNDQATTCNVKIAMREKLAEVQPDDMVVIYWSGHGGPDPKAESNLYLITHDSDPEHMAATSYAMDEFKADVSRLKSRNVLILADTCHSAGISDPKVGLKGPADNKIVEGIKGVIVTGDDKSPQPVAKPMWMIFTSCEAGEYSRESAELGSGHGVFTWFLLKGLGGDADTSQYGGNGDGKVTVGEMVEYTRDQVKRFTRNQQHPDVAGQFDRSFLIASPK